MIVSGNLKRAVPTYMKDAHTWVISKFYNVVVVEDVFFWKY